MRDLRQERTGETPRRTCGIEVAGGDGPPWVTVTAAEYPRLHEALETISHDAGMGAGHASYALDAAWADELAAAERGLASLTDPEDFQTFCIGDQDEAEKMLGLHPDLPAANSLLEKFFGEAGEAG